MDSAQQREDEKYMRLALREAMKGAGQTSPNPAVGALIVRGKEMLARGFHRAAGLPHAEIEALRSLRKPNEAAGATLYVTLEPCSTAGRTPPCVEAIVTTKIGRVVIGTIDPNPVHAGRAVEILRAAGIDVTTSVLEKECRELNRAFNKWIVTGMPFVIAKLGMSLDARISRPAEEGRWITSAAARYHAHELRARVDAILIGGGTLRSDDPQLTVRGIPGARQPWRVVVSRSGKFPRTARLFTDRFRNKTLFYQGKSLRAVLRDLGRKQITSVMIEGGTRVLGEAFDRRLVDRVQFYVAPLLLGGPQLSIGGRGVSKTADSATIKNVSYVKLGEDLLLTGDVAYPPMAASRAPLASK
ncbi:MAG: bifunctional diaminohydroxyphosphoribosylaminopyrimidine deaminase/5-amino-6-(5-phosphoribosylamino)uracil reductase RibD [Verrucomicrobiota bacterium]|nr:bifunctional diaminohydroxyphosphoribosylaminopyrimidine deaminase/5-amino-6-(5-phosphoribosylamino)uracil reductase RibD [Verrucomicrobiota bacterium]